MIKKISNLLFIGLFTTMCLTLTFASDREAIQGSDVRASLLSGGENEFFVIDPMTSGNYTIETRGQVDTYGILYNSKNEIIAESDDGDNYDSNFKLTASLSIYETYYLSVSGYAYEDTGFYTVVVTKEGMNEMSLSSGVKTSDPMYVSTPITSVLSRGSENFYSFVAPIDGTYSFASNGSIDTYGILIDNEGNFLASDDDTYDGNGNFLINVTLEQGKTYILGVGGYDYYTSGTYEVGVQRGAYIGFDQDDDTWYESDPSVSFELADELTFNTPLATAISEGSINTFVFSPVADGSYTIMTTGDVDTYGTLYDAETLYLTSSDDATYEDYNFRIDTLLEAGKTYYLTVEGYGYDDTGVVEVQWLNSEDAPSLTESDDSEYIDEEAYNAWLESAVTLELDAPQTGNFDLEPENLYQFIPDETGVYSIESMGQLDTYAMLYTEDTYIAMSDDISDDDYNFQLQEALEAGETYYIYVSYYDDLAFESYDVVIKRAVAAE